ncbi:uncharacterized protein LOC119737610 [Patiria miniata]|uniref:CUE domain-containing protein n=1 Tax=Patiria miniata TaxID=46514 RepID=A0A914AWV2_PATMI|nr:uncharacterized protein LOC119737610 [Patiria miniata]
MDLAEQVEQVLMVCPDIPRADIERDLSVTADVQETINRIFEGNFLVGAAPQHELPPAVAERQLSSPTPLNEKELSSHHQPRNQDNHNSRLHQHDFGITGCGSSTDTCSDKHTDSDDASDCSDLPDISLRQRVTRQDLSSFDEEVVAWSPSPNFESGEGPSTCSPISLSSRDSDSENSNTENRSPSQDLSERSLRRTGTSPEYDILEHNANVVHHSTGKQLDKIQGSETFEKEINFEGIETVGLPDQGDCRSGNNTMDSNGGCSPMSISSDEEEGITLSLLHRIRSKQTKNHQTVVENYRSSHPQDKADTCGVTTTKNDYQSYKASDRNVANLSHDRKKTDCPKTGSKKYHDISSDDEDDASVRTNSSSTCHSRLPESGHCASRWQEDEQTLHSSQGTSCSSSALSQESSYDTAPVRKKAKRSPEEIVAAKQQALERRAQKDQEKQQKMRQLEERKQQKQREAQVQRALREAHKADKPEECMKYITVVIDPLLLEDSVGATLLAKLQELNSKTAVESQAIPGSITWRRQVMQHNLGDDLQLQTLQHEKEECEALIQLSVASFVDLVHAFKQEQQGAYCTGQESLRTYARNTQQILQGNAVTFIVQGMEKYFRLQKNSRQRNFRSAVLGNEPTENAAKARRKKRPIEDITTVVTRVDVEEALVDLQLHVGCNVRFVETPAEVADLVAMVTKSVAETPFKRERDKATFSFHVDTEWAGGVKVKKDGQGLRRVWRQQLQQFRNVSPQVANSIIAVYPSPRQLLQAYARCDSVQEARKVLQDIVIRRGEGVLATTRRVGPELSKRIHTLMTSRQPDLDL